MPTDPTSVTRRESLRLFGSGLAATAVSLSDRLHDSWPAENALDRARLLQLLGAVSVAVPPLAAEWVERAGLGDIVREKEPTRAPLGVNIPGLPIGPFSADLTWPDLGDP